LQNKINRLHSVNGSSATCFSLVMVIITNNTLPGILWFPEFYITRAWMCFWELFILHHNMWPMKYNPFPGTCMLCVWLYVTITSLLLNSDHIPQSISTFTHKGYKYKLQTINSQRKREQTGIAINIVTVLQSLHHGHR